MTSSPFKPCPFCGDKCVMNFEKGEFKLRCYSCHAKMEWFTNEDEAIEAWNKRDCSDNDAYQLGLEDAISFLRAEIEILRATENKIPGGLNPIFLRGIAYAIDTLFEHIPNDEVSNE